MSARNYLSAREKNYGKLVDCLPNINQKFGFRSGQELPPLSANTSKVLNRNLNYSYTSNHFLNAVERAATPLSDFFSESETGTPDFLSEESDSSSGSALRRSTAEASKAIAQEWARIERTIYNEDGEKTARPAMLEECKQWRELHPQLRVVGKAIQLPEKRSCYRQIEHDEVIEMHYSDYEQFSESEERLSQSSSDVTPQNSPRPSVEELHEPRISREKVSFQTCDEEIDLTDSFSSLLQITPIQIRSPYRKKNILRSEVASSKWMRGSRPDSSVNCDRNSAKSFVSLDTRNYMALSASDRNNILNGGRVGTAKPKDIGRLEPFSMYDSNELRMNGTYNIRKVSLPPLLLEEERRKVVSAKKHVKPRKSVTKAFYHLDRFRH